MNPCTKCGEADNLHTRWLASQGAGRMSGRSRRSACETNDKEHLHRSCRTCGYEWCEPTLEQRPKPPEEPRCKRCGDSGIVNGCNPAPGAYGFRAQICSCRKQPWAPITIRAFLWRGPLERPTEPAQLDLPFTRLVYQPK